MPIFYHETLLKIHKSYSVNTLETITNAILLYTFGRNLELYMGRKVLLLPFIFFITFTEGNRHKTFIDIEMFKPFNKNLKNEESSLFPFTRTLPFLFIFNPYVSGLLRLKLYGTFLSLCVITDYFVTTEYSDPTSEKYCRYDLLMSYVVTGLMSGLIRMSV